MRFQSIASYSAATLGFSAIAEGLAVVQTGGYLRLLYASRDANRAGVLTVGAAPAAAAADAFAAAGHGSDLAVQLTDSATRAFLYPTTGTLRASTVTAAGAISGNGTVSTSLGLLSGIRTMEVIERAGGDLAAVAQRGLDGFRLFALSDSGSMTLLSTIADGPKTYVAEPSDMARLTVGGHDFLLVLSAAENGITCYEIGADNSLQFTDAMGVESGLPVNGPAAVAVAAVAGAEYAVVASTNSSSLTVLRVNAMGVLFPTDHVIDDRDTRFAHVAVVGTFAVQDRVFVVAAGSDAGLSLFELLPGGTLSEMTSIALETGAGLADVTGLAVAVTGGVAHVFLTDAQGDRILEYGLDVSALTPAIYATGGTTTGTAGEDRIFGSAGADTLNGGAGDDFLHDGAGVDLLRGGAGADVFVLVHDGQTDRIADFQQGSDRIDLSDWGRIYSVAGLSVTATATGAVVIWGDERLEITSATGTPLTLTDADFLF